MYSICSRTFFLGFILIIAVSGCASRGAVVPAHYLVDNQPTSGSFGTPPWILNFEYFYRPAEEETAEGTITVASTFTLISEGIEAIHLQIVFIDAEGRVLSKPEFQNITQFAGNTVQNEKLLPVPAGAVAFSFEGDTRGGRPSGDNRRIFGLP